MMYDKNIVALEKILKHHYDMRVERVKTAMTQIDYLRRQQADLSNVLPYDSMDDAFIRYANLYGKKIRSDFVRDKLIDSYINLTPMELR